MTTECCVKGCHNNREPGSPGCYRHPDVLRETCSLPVPVTPIRRAYAVNYCRDTAAGPLVSVMPFFPTSDHGAVNFVSSIFYMSPDEARALARDLAERADEAEGKLEAGHA